MVGDNEIIPVVTIVFKPLLVVGAVRGVSQEENQDGWLLLYLLSPQNIQRCQGSLVENPPVTGRNLSRVLFILYGFYSRQRDAICLVGLHLGELGIKEMV